MMNHYWLRLCLSTHYVIAIIMSATASQITGVSIVWSPVCSGADQRKHQRFASLAFVTWNHRWPVDSPHKGAVTRKMFPFDNVIMRTADTPLSKLTMIHFSDEYMRHQTSVWLYLPGAICVQNTSGLNSRSCKMFQKLVEHQACLIFNTLKNMYLDFTLTVMPCRPDPNYMYLNIPKDRQPVLTHWVRDKMAAIFQTIFFQMRFIE